MNQDQIAADIEKVLTQKSINPRSMASREKRPATTAGEEDSNVVDIYGMKPSMSSFYVQKGITNPLLGPKPTKRAASPIEEFPAPAPQNPPFGSPSSPPSEALNQLTKETQDRAAKAKITMLTKKLADAAEIREKLEIQMGDMRKQLNTVREENKSLGSRVNSLESELRRTSSSNRKGTVEQSARDNATENLIAERDGLKRDLDAAERLVRQANENAKNKDAQLKRAVETIARLKSQLDDAQSTVQTGQSVDTAKFTAMEARIRTLEKQRADLVEGFRKQMKLINVLKRQKIHLEAARLLAFTEEEFMKTLDWKS
jgi:hypothetical protein